MTSKYDFDKTKVSVQCVIDSITKRRCVNCFKDIDFPFSIPLCRRCRKEYFIRRRLEK
jgi:hypothetical protein